LAERDGFEPPVPLVSRASGRFLPVSVLCQRRSARLNRAGERLASDSDQSDVYVCPKKERAGMKRNPSESGTKNLADELAELRGLNATTLKQRWRVLYRTEAPVHIGRAFLLQAAAYRLQERVLGGLKPSTRRLLERAAEDNVERRPPTEAPAAKITPGSVLIREWHGVSHRVTVLGDGVLLRGARYRSLSEVARKITGTRWSGPRFFGLRAPTKRSDHGTR
jgi:hypothetical protein